MRLMLVLVLVRVILNGAEALVWRKNYAHTGLYSWSLRRLRHYWMMQGAPGYTLNVVLRYPGYMHLVVLQTISAVVLLVPGSMPSAPALLPIILAVEFLSLVRSGGYGMEGSDQLHLILLCNLTIYYATADPLARRAVVWFIALQLMLAYFTAGVAKLRTRQWRKGTAINSVLSTESYGSRLLAEWLGKMPAAGKFMCWGVIVFECAFPFAILASPQIALAALLCGAVFHLTIAASMGLNGFFWTFISAYPAIYFFSLDFRSLIYSHAFLR
jgi:hypothetical protein